MKCVLHVDSSGQSSGNIEPFDDVKWTQVKQSEQSRRKQFKRSKYFAISLPEHFSSDMGYHKICYSNFTATKKGSDSPGSNLSQPVGLRSESSRDNSTSRVGLFPVACIFCDKITKNPCKGKRETLSKCETLEAQSTIMKSAQELQDEALLTKINGVDFIAKEVQYHNSCRSAYNRRAAHKENRGEQSYRFTSHQNAFSLLRDYIDLNLIECAGAEKLTSLHARYINYLGQPDSSYETKSLCLKIQNAYPDTLKFHKDNKKAGIVIYHPSMTPDEAVRHTQLDEYSVKDVAMHLRKQILAMSATSHGLPESLSAEALDKGEGLRPKVLSDFFRVLYTGLRSPPTDNDKIERLVNAVTDDTIYATTRGRVKPGKHLTLGVGLKSLTGSRKVIDILNRFGHCVSYHIVESVETELATNITNRNCYTPDGISPLPGLATGLAWDNYDEFTETLSGSGSLHDTVGICYQNKFQPPVSDPTDTASNTSTTSEAVPDRTLKLTRRSLILKERNVEPYRKKPKITVFSYTEKEVPRPPCITTLKYRDMLWMMGLTVDTSAMWVGWNAQVTRDPLPVQRVEYMENITLPSTRLDVIAETLRISQQVARECGDEYAVVSYDLLMAKSALQIQAAESPRYDDVFICFGPFHTEMAYFGALGYILDGSGGLEILTEVGVLAAGSLNGLLLGKHYNRCKRLYPLLATAMQILHFRRYLEVTGPLPESMVEILERLRTNPSAEAMDEIERSDGYLEYMVAYEQYRQRTLSGEHGSTAQYWMIVVELVGTFLLFNRSCRTNDLDVFMYALDNMCPVYFAASRPNYARWMVLYLLNLLNIENTHPGLRPMLESGAFTVRRTTKSFSRAAVDITLEQTVNSDAASRQTGIASFTHLAAARGRWMVTRAVRSAVVGNLLSKAGISSAEDTTKELKPYRIKRDNEDLASVIHGIENTMNPFALEPDDNLYCITTGKKTNDDIKADLLDLQPIGRAWCEEFRMGCHDNPARFEKPIPRRKIRNFASATVKSKAPNKDMKIKQLEGTRDLFGRLLYLSTKADLDMEKIFQYPLTPVPLSLAHFDGSMNNTNKSTLMHHLESMAAGGVPTGVSVTVVDAMFILHSQVDIPATYGGIALRLLQQLCAMSGRTDFIGDQYVCPSIKDIERDRRGQTDSAYQISGPDQRRPTEWQTSLKSPSFKTSLLRFLASEWQRPIYAPILAGHSLYLALDKQCFRFTEANGTVIRDEIQSLRCNHEEADTRVIYHVHKILSEQRDTTVVVRADDTDILVLLVYHAAHFEGNPKVWLDAGNSSKNTRRYIDVGSIVSSMDAQVLEALPAIHAFTGSDFTPSFLNKGKVRPFQLMSKSSEFTACFAGLGTHTNLSDAVINESSIERYVCALYGRPKLSSVDKARHAMFQLNFAPKRGNDPMERIKGINASSLPPCQAVLIENLRRTNLVASMWKNATSSNPCLLDPQENGWILLDGTYHIRWYKCDTVPQNVWQVLDSELPVDVEEPEYTDPIYEELLYGPDEYNDTDDYY